MTVHDPLATAQLRATEARERLMDTVGTLQTRLEPRNMARDAVEGLADSGQRAIDAAVDGVQRHSGKLAGGIAIVALFAARHRIAALFRKRASPAKPAPVRRVPVTKTRRPRRDEEAT